MKHRAKVFSSHVDKRPETLFSADMSRVFLRASVAYSSAQARGGNGSVLPFSVWVKRQEGP